MGTAFDDLRAGHLLEQAARAIENLLSWIDHPSPADLTDQWLKAIQNDICDAFRSAKGAAEHEPALREAERQALDLASFIHSRPELTAMPFNAWGPHCPADLIGDLRRLARELRRAAGSKGALPDNKGALLFSREHPSETGTSQTTPAPTPPPDDQLTNTMLRILKALRRLKAVNADSRRTAKEIATKVDPDTSADSLKNPLSTLKKMNFIDSKGPGRGSGYWITPTGLARIEKLPK